jgi:hypothetical protein
MEAGPDKVVRPQQPYSSSASEAPFFNAAVLDVDDLPTAVREAAFLLRTHAVIAWTKLDPAQESRVFGHAVGTTVWPCLVFPCLWPLLIVAPLIVAWAKIDREQSLKNQYWVLTTAELKIVTMDYERPGCCGASSGTSVRTIALEDIAGCGGQCSFAGQALLLPCS